MTGGQPDTTATRAAMNGNAIERLDIRQIDPHTFRRRYRKRGVPVVITGAFDGVSPWTLDYLQQHLSGSSYRVREFSVNRGIPKEQWTAYSAVHQMEFEPYAQLLRNGTAAQRDIYMSQITLTESHSLMQTIDGQVERIRRTCGIGERIWKEVYGQVWIGPGGHTEPLHSDAGDGTLCQLYGDRRVVLFPASQHRNLYPFAFFSRVEPWVSRADINQPDFNRFPRLRTALQHRTEVHLKQGEVLFIPAQWSHEVTNLDDCYGTSFSVMWKIPLRRNLISGRAFAWLFLRKCPSFVAGPLIRLLSPKFNG